MNLGAQAAARIYREHAVDGASPARLVRLLLERALRGLERAGACDAGDPRSPFVSELQRAADIVTELRLSIVPSGDAAADETAAATHALYEFVGVQIHTALAQRSAEPALLARPVLQSLLEAWSKIEEGQA
ncbi:MAG: flagellar protein FliS [Planctomycetota bacterium]